MGRGVGVKREHSLRGFCRHAGEFDRVLPQAGAPFKGIEACADEFEIGRPVGLGNRIASRPGFTTAARSSSVNPVSSALTRTKQRHVRSGLSSTRLATRARAGPFLAGATESSRSRMRTSAPRSVARSNLRPESPGTKRSERSLISGSANLVARRDQGATGSELLRPQPQHRLQDIVGEGVRSRDATRMTPLWARIARTGVAQ